MVRHCLIHSQIENRPVTDNKLQFATFFLSHTHIPCASLFTRLQKSIQPFRKALSALNVRSCSHFSFVTLAHALGRKKCLCNRFRYNYLLPIISFTCVELEELRHSFELTLFTHFMLCLRSNETVEISERGIFIAISWWFDTGKMSK